MVNGERYVFNASNITVSGKVYSMSDREVTFTSPVKTITIGGQTLTLKVTRTSAFGIYRNFWRSGAYFKFLFIMFILFLVFFFVLAVPCLVGECYGDALIITIVLSALTLPWFAYYFVVYV